MPGGSGLLDQIIERFGDVVAAACAVVDGCPSACAASCIDCLQTFRNGYYHKFLDRTVASEAFEAWGRRLVQSHDIPAKQPSKEPSEGSYPVNEAETRLRHLLLAAGFEEGVRGEQIKLDAAIGTTTLPRRWIRGIVAVPSLLVTLSDPRGPWPGALRPVGVLRAACPASLTRGVAPTLRRPLPPRKGGRTTPRNSICAWPGHSRTTAALRPRMPPKLTRNSVV
jgi:hypothetical protein